MSAGHYDRNNTKRLDADWVQAQLRRPDARYLVFDESLKLYLDNINFWPHWLQSESALELETSSAPILYLGEDDTRVLCAVQTSAQLDNPTSTFTHLRAAVPVLPPAVAAAASHARSLFAFHKAHQYCGWCGSKTVSQQGGARRQCTNCGATAYPRVDPAVIMLILHPTSDHVLLARQPRHPVGMYTCLAGHMEHGESVYDAVRRETFEETGIEVGEVRFLDSQPWPFPYTLMLGCVVIAKSTHITLDRDELEDAMWVSRADVAKMLAARDGAMRWRRLETGRDLNKDLPLEQVQRFVPPSQAIAGQMLEAYIQRPNSGVFDFSVAEKTESRL